MAKCTEEDCDVMISGVCINGMKVEECTHYKLTDDGNIDYEYHPEDEVPEDAIPDIGIKDVHSGKALSIDEADSIARSSQTRLIILAGMPEAGKTTFILSLHHLFSTNKEYGGYIFAGSETLVDYEEMSHPSKIESDLKKPVTVRTPRGSERFMHLMVKKTEQENSFVNLLFTDIPGETFSALKDSRQECERFTLAKRADHFVLFFDTEILTTISKRAIAKATGIGILRGLIEVESLEPGASIQIVFSRWDLFNRDKNEADHILFLNAIKKELQVSYGQNYDISFFEVSCRPDNISVPFGYGMDIIFPTWVGHRPIKTSNSGNVNKEIPANCTREYLKFNFNQT